MGKIKRTLIIFIIAVLCLSNAGCSIIRKAYAESIILPPIVNDSFESQQEQSAYSKPIGWQVDAVDQVEIGNVAFINENAYDGQSYYQVSGDEYTVKTEDYIDIDGGESYVFGVKYITSSLENSCTINIETFDNENNLLSTIANQVEEPKLVDTWLDTQFYINASTSVSKVKIAIKINALNGDVGIDYAYGNKDIIKISFGASISLQQGKTEMRFTGQIDKTAYEKFLGKSVSVGILFMPTNAFNQTGEFTIKGLSSETGRASVADKWKNQETIDSDGYYEFACAMKNMHVKEALTVSISARAFIKFTEEGKEKYIYSTFNLEDNSRSIQGVAQKLKADTTNYQKYDELQRMIIDAYALGELPKIAR